MQAQHHDFDKMIKPVAVFKSPYGSKFGIPRQSGLTEAVTGRIVFLPPYNDPNAIRGIADFDYLWLIWGFSANEPQPSATREADNNNETAKASTDETDSRNLHLTVRPPRLGGNERVGVFASRSPFRPNGLGLSSVRILGEDNGEIIVAGADLMNGTPIYDIKPYLPYVDAHPDAKAGFTDKRKWTTLEVSIPNDISEKLTDKQTRELQQILSLDPRPHYHHDSNRIYGMTYAGHNVRFKVEGNLLTIVEII